jgi:alpha-tubulin suppressor-like RCC1 family protein
MRCVLFGGGQVACWGLTPGNGSAGSSVPVKVTGIEGATAVSAGEDFACAILADRTVTCWGGNHFGQLGNGTKTDTLVPVVVSGAVGATKISAGSGSVCAILTDDTLRCWGEGFLGNGLGNGSAVPVPVTGLAGVSAVSVGDGFTCALLDDGTVQCWGDNALGDLGMDYQTLRLSATPIPISGIAGATEISASGNTVCALLSTGTVKCWGDSSDGQLGSDGPVVKAGELVASSPTPVAIVGISGAKAIATSSVLGCALLSDGKVDCWGRMAAGPLTSTTSVAPVEVPGLMGADSLDCGGVCCSVLMSGNVDCWGYGAFAPSGDLTAVIAP